MIRLNPAWTALMKNYEADHQDARNQACHRIGIPLVVASVPVAATRIGLPIAAGMFALGWAFQLLGHACEGKRPSFVADSRYLWVGVLWWLKKAGCRFL